MRIGFDNEKYLKEQTRSIMDRLRSSNGKLYMECGGKLLYDYHASRVLPGFDPNVKMRVFQGIKDQLDVIICIYAGDVEHRKIRSDFGITYDTDVFKMIDDFSRWGLECTKVVITRYDRMDDTVERFRALLERRGIQVFLHKSTPGYPADVELIVSDAGYGANPYIPTDRPVVLVTAPGPGSGKLATCLSEMYHDGKAGRKSGYAKFETFPIWDLPIDHPVNIAYESATADIGDRNRIDHYHLAAYGTAAVNYSRDLEAFPLLTRILEKITGAECVYKSPTDMGTTAAPRESSMTRWCAPRPSRRSSDGTCTRPRITRWGWEARKRKSAVAPSCNGAGSPRRICPWCLWRGRRSPMPSRRAKESAGWCARRRSSCRTKQW